MAPGLFYKLERKKKTKLGTFPWKLANPSVWRQLDFGKQRLCKLTKNDEKVKLCLRAGFYCFSMVQKCVGPKKRRACAGLVCWQDCFFLIFCFFFIKKKDKKLDRRKNIEFDRRNDRATHQEVCCVDWASNQRRGGIKHGCTTIAHTP